ncbi:hypothetical protein CGT92_18145 [Vibrio metoecus]|uniref:hypothetical protein n=1 Tax=Vibrio metoecus TaxID=1481663 RepID=UPI0006D79098|nr:hypothetical protein [Vibrio metoecus]KQA95826.1 hypothetical protein XV91_17720 [Vibrio metoecus]PAR52930.1 hypothetical protein CGT92_18145 [Vibrio metoecus]
MENIDSFVRLVCGTDFDSNKELDKILLHLSTSLQKVTRELVELQSMSDDKLGLYGPYLGRSILELSMTALIARIDPFKILLMKGKQVQPDYDLGKPHSSAIRWQGDVVDDAVPNLWADKSLKDPTRAIFGAYQIHLVLKNSAELVIDEGDEDSMGEWYSQFSSTTANGTIESIKSKINSAYSSLSKGIHHELLVPQESILDRDTVISILNETFYIIASTGLLVSQIPHAYKKTELRQSFMDYKNSKELELS